MQFSGDFPLSWKLARAWEKLSDVRYLVQRVPGAEKVTSVEEDHAQLKVKPGFSFAPGSLNMTIQRLEMDPGKSARFAFASKGIGSSCDVETQIFLEENGEETLVRWTGEIKKLGGLLKAVPHGLIKGAAQKVVEQFLANIKTEAESA